MRKINKTIFVFMVSLLGMGIVSSADFSARVTSSANDQTVSGKIYMSGTKVRMETDQGTMIFRPDKSVVWMLMPDNKYMEMALTKENQPAPVTALSDLPDKKFLSKDKLGQQLADKYSITQKTETGPIEMLVWFIPGMDLPIRTADPQGKWYMEYSDIQTSSQPDSLFELPANYQKIAMPDISQIQGMAQEGKQ
jgi:hypothetical protein